MATIKRKCRGLFYGIPHGRDAVATNGAVFPTGAFPVTAVTVYTLFSMIGFFIRLAATVVALFAVAWFSNGAVQVKNLPSGIIAALVLGVGNALVKPVLYFVAKKVTCVLSCVTLGLWSLLLSWLLSALIFYGAGQLLGGFTVSTFGAAMFGALVLAVVNTAAGIVTKKEDE